MGFARNLCRHGLGAATVALSPGSSRFAAHPASPTLAATAGAPIAGYAFARRNLLSEALPDRRPDE